jgi:hypothetical protein
MSEEQKTPTIDELIDHLQEQIRLAEVRSKLQTLNTQIAKERAEELNALVFIAQVTNPKEQDVSDETLEQEGEEAPKRKLKK